MAILPTSCLRNPFFSTLLGVSHQWARRIWDAACPTQAEPCGDENRLMSRGVDSEDGSLRFSSTPGGDYGIAGDLRGSGVDPALSRHLPEPVSTVALHRRPARWRRAPHAAPAAPP